MDGLGVGLSAPWSSRAPGDVGDDIPPHGHARRRAQAQHLHRAAHPLRAIETGEAEPLLDDFISNDTSTLPMLSIR
ncbi:MAG: hypothetical protein M3401_14195 [Actinomycetota bacterium]|nr:hypothetical protein [Actinomycetota bacterium]